MSEGLRLQNEGLGSGGEELLLQGDGIRLENERVGLRSDAVRLGSGGLRLRAECVGLAAVTGLLWSDGRGPEGERLSVEGAGLCGPKGHHSIAHDRQVVVGNRNIDEVRRTGVNHAGPSGLVGC